jgi:nucleoside-triphosphatase THEP1
MTLNKFSLDFIGMIDPDPWFTVYFALGLDCSIPVLEALHYNAWLGGLSLETFGGLDAKVIAIVGRRCSGKTVLVHRLAKHLSWDNIYNVTPKDIPVIARSLLSNTTVVFDDIGPFTFLAADTGPLLNNIYHATNGRIIFVCQYFKDIPVSLRSRIDCCILGRLDSYERASPCRHIDSLKNPDLGQYQWFVAAPHIHKFWLLETGEMAELELNETLI